MSKDRREDTGSQAETNGDVQRIDKRLKTDEMRQVVRSVGKCLKTGKKRQVVRQTQREITRQQANVSDRPEETSSLADTEGGNQRVGKCPR